MGRGQMRGQVCRESAGGDSGHWGGLDAAGNCGHGQLFQGPRCRQALLSSAGLISLPAAKSLHIQLQ